MTPTLAATWTAIGTLALALMTLVAVATTVIITMQDRRRAAVGLAAERAQADERLRDERDHAETARRRERQADNVRVLLQRVAALPYLDAVPGQRLRRLHSAVSLARVGDTDDGCASAIESLRHGAFAEAPLLAGGDAAGAAAARYRFLIQLVLTTANDNGSDPKQLAGTLRNYARWVRISLRMLAENQTVPPIRGGSPEVPLLGLPDDAPIWQPDPIPPDGTRNLTQRPLDERGPLSPQGDPAPQERWPRAWRPWRGMRALPSAEALARWQVQRDPARR